jgi:hypothetical protein
MRTLQSFSYVMPLDVDALPTQSYRARRSPIRRKVDTEAAHDRAHTPQSGSCRLHAPASAEEAVDPHSDDSLTVQPPPQELNAACKRIRSSRFRVCRAEWRIERVVRTGVHVQLHLTASCGHRVS